jgi:hypothetical protein
MEMPMDDPPSANVHRRSRGKCQNYTDHPSRQPFTAWRSTP